MIQNAVIHLANEQPLVADLFEMPATTDVALACTNLRTLSGKRPLFADHTESFFLFPLIHIRFIEVPPAAAGLESNGHGDAGESTLARLREDQPEEDLTIDEDFLRRVREA
jgi:hypothetical protein